jgi:RNA polymerase sigma-70 factor (family 1)
MAIETVVQSDQDVFEQLRKGDEKALEYLFRKYYSALCNYSAGLLKDESAAEDAVQDVFMKIWNTRNSLPVVIAVKSYFYTAVRNHSLNLLAKVTHHDSDLSLITSVHEDVTEKLEYLELEAKYKLALERLPERCREIFILSRNEGMSYKEIAEVMDISVKTVENQMGKALRIMREMLLSLLVFIFIENL